MNREVLERRVLSGEPVRLVAADTPFDARSAMRHLRNHVDPDFLAAARRATVGAHVSDFAGRLASLAEETAAVRSYATGRGDPRLLLDAIKQESDTLSVLMGRLGVDDTETIDTLRESRVFAAAVASVLGRADPEVARELAGELEQRGERELACAVERIADRAAVRQIEARETA